MVLQKNVIGIILGFIFMIMTFLYTRGIFTPFFACMIVLLLFIAFLKEESRVFTWVLITFFLGNLMVGYASQFLERFRLSAFSFVMFNQLLLLIPIFMIHYVLIKFKRKMSIYFGRPSISSSAQVFYIILSIIILLSFPTLLYMNKMPVNGQSFLYILLFSITYAVLQEVLWRGLLLPHFRLTAGNKIGVIMTSMAFGFNTSLFSQTFTLTILFILIGFLFAIITVKTKSIYPSIFIHASIIALLLISGLMVLPI
ncbi:CPBP family intramembrane glutamic endopeptidase [Neobacillus sp. GCM10023253]|uniref:CPBP family intramembrane glutamic endopeptidase n=1 Tax=Neobacillus sp. GCM10023253 TaxID=3252644 RepID=UPI00361EBC88